MAHFLLTLFAFVVPFFVSLSPKNSFCRTGILSFIAFLFVIKSVISTKNCSNKNMFFKLFKKEANIQRRHIQWLCKRPPTIIIIALYFACYVLFLSLSFSLIRASAAQKIYSAAIYKAIRTSQKKRTIAVYLVRTIHPIPILNNCNNNLKHSFLHTHTYTDVDVYVNKMLLQRMKCEKCNSNSNWQSIRVLHSFLLFSYMFDIHQFFLFVVFVYYCISLSFLEFFTTTKIANTNRQQ